MFQSAIAQHGAPHVVHADSGPRCTSNLLRDYLHQQTRTLPQPAVRLQRQPVLRGRVPDDEVPARLPRRSPISRPHAVHRRLRALVQPPPQTLRHRPVLTRRSPRRNLATGRKSATARCNATTKITRNASTHGPPPHARRHGRHQPTPTETAKARRMTPHSLTTCGCGQLVPAHRDQLSAWDQLRMRAGRARLPVAPRCWSSLSRPRDVPRDWLAGSRQARPTCECAPRAASVTMGE